MVLNILVALVIAFSPAPRDCAKLKQDTFNLLLSVKETCDEDFKDCCTISQLAKGANFLGQAKGKAIYDIQNPCSNGQQPFLSHAQSVTVLQARCDMDTQSGGWIVIMRRKSDVAPLVNFTRTFAEYEHGFGDLNTEFWYGLKNIHCLTQRDDVELIIEQKKRDESDITWIYKEFKVDGPQTNYVLHMGGEERIAGAGGDGMAYHNGQRFSTFDRDNDRHDYVHCAAAVTQGNGAGWWYNACYGSPLTLPHSGPRRMSWGGVYFPDQLEMKIRPKNCSVA